MHCGSEFIVRFSSKVGCVLPPRGLMTPTASVSGQWPPLTKRACPFAEIAEATALSSSRVHQILHDNEAHGIPDWLDDFRTRESPAEDPPAIGKSTTAQILLSTEVAILRRCIDWLKQLESERWVVEELRPITEAGGKRVLLDRQQVLRILSRIAAELDGLAGRPDPGSAGSGDGREGTRAGGYGVEVAGDDGGVHRFAYHDFGGLHRAGRRYRNFGSSAAKGEHQTGAQ